MSNRRTQRPKPAADVDAIRVVVVVSDLHCGSPFGLCPPDSPTADGSGYRLNRAQEWLWGRWQCDLAEWVPSVVGRRPWALVVNGDAIEGNHHGSLQLVHGDPNVHGRIAYECLLPLAARASKVFLVRGTESHVGTAESVLGERLGAVRDPTTGDYCWEQISLRISGTACSFRHHMATSLRPWTAGGGLAAAIVQEQAVAAGFGHPVPRVVVRSHRHRFGVYTGAEGLMLATAPWQLMTRYARRVTQQSITPVGIAALDFRGEAPRVLHTLHTPDPDPVIELSP
jgi:hypothetical protein